MPGQHVADEHGAGIARIMSILIADYAPDELLKPQREGNA